MNHQRGLTTVDVIITATVFLMMAAVAVPRFALLSETARVDAVKNLAENVRNSVELTHRVWDSAGRPDALTRNGETLEIRHGYPTARSVGSLVFGASDFRHANGVWRYVEGAQTYFGCSVVYDPPQLDGERPFVTANIDGC